MTDNINEKITEKIQYPKLFKIRQKFHNTKIEDIPQEVVNEIDSIKEKINIEPGMKIAITAGSRGISNIDIIIKTLCDYVKEKGAQPIIIPAMGSHGGATAQGQIELLKKLGIDEGTMGAHIISSMEVVQLGTTSNGSPVYMDVNAYHSDGIIVINRIKPHTDFIGDTESGLMKVIAVGLGKEKGCSAMHSYGLNETIPKAARIALEKAPILFGLGIVENSQDETSILRALTPDVLEEEEKKLLIQAKSLVPQIPADHLDILVVQEMGKMFSGTGMDTKVIGRMKVFGEEEPKRPNINKLVVLNLAKSSYGNAIGIGLADITTRKLVDSIDYDAMYTNLLPTTFLERGKIPVTMPGDKEAIELAFQTLGNWELSSVRCGIIKNTLELQELYVTEEVLKNMDKNKIEILEENIEIIFDKDGNLNL